MGNLFITSEYNCKTVEAFIGNHSLSEKALCGILVSCLVTDPKNLPPSV